MNCTRNKAERLGTYLTITVGAGTLAGTSDAAIVNLDLSAFSGPNAGLTSGSSKTISLQILDGRLTGSLNCVHEKSSAQYLLTGLVSVGDAAILSGYGYASPTRLTAGSLVDEEAGYFATWDLPTAFRAYEPRYEANGYVYGGNLHQSPNFDAGSFLGFKSANGHFGWLEVTWDSDSGVFEILGGAFEDVAGVGIQAGAVSAVPEPAGALGTLGLLSAGMFLRRRKLAA